MKKMYLWTQSHSVLSKLAISMIRFGTCVEIDDVLSLLKILNLPCERPSPAFFCSVFQEVDLYALCKPSSIAFQLWPGMANGRNQKELEKKKRLECLFLRCFLSVALCLRPQLLLKDPFLWLSVVSSSHSFYLLPIVACPRMPHHPLWFPLTLPTFCAQSLYPTIFNHPFWLRCSLLCRCFWRSWRRKKGGLGVTMAF